MSPLGWPSSTVSLDLETKHLTTAGGWLASLTPLQKKEILFLNHLAVWSSCSGRMRSNPLSRPLAHWDIFALWGRRFQFQKAEVPVSVSLHGKGSAARSRKLCGGHPTHPHSQQDQAPTLCGYLYPCLTLVKTEAGTGTIYDPELVFTGPVYRKPVTCSALVFTCPLCILHKWAAEDSLSPTVAVNLCPPGI